MNQKKGINQQQIEPRKTAASNKKKIQDQASMGSSLLKKNEFTLIIAGALVVTAIVFFLFFRSSGPGKVEPVSDTGSSAKLEERIKNMESALEELKMMKEQVGLSGENSEADPSVKKDLVEVRQNLSRLENSVTLKLDSLIRRMNVLEKQMVGIKEAKAPATKAPVKKVEKKAVVASKPPVKKPAVKATKKTSMFHTVKKGETLWSISQKYKTTVAKLRKLNNLTPETKIYPGTNILIR
ncbi:LysM peptidoglycan-binding domain-containing protein [Desulfospira joergensenii]|uniref:LysM peptidoglycan-binding domain-containing protein n=1 Tax=Desulfospira joergensenii TaxID=53329 RepID=UPI0003B71A59|nr:LysM domain-containing protein [Desulfospira joergensenii]